MQTSDHAITSKGQRRRAGGKRMLGCCLALCALAVSVPARAEEIGTKGNLVIAAERLFGLYIDNQSRDGSAAHHTVFALAWSGTASSSLSMPRIGIDYFLSDAFTLGGNIGFFSHNVSQTNLSRTETGVLFGARAGYALRLSHAISFWPRGGFSYATISSDGAAGDTHVLALTIDAPFTLAPSEGFAILVGPCLEVGVLGKSGRQDFSEVLFGLMVGLAGWTGL